MEEESLIEKGFTEYFDMNGRLENGCELRTDEFGKSRIILCLNVCKSAEDGTESRRQLRRREKELLDLVQPWFRQDMVVCDE